VKPLASRAGSGLQARGKSEGMAPTVRVPMPRFLTKFA
jgi:hypothetical protein